MTTLATLRHGRCETAPAVSSSAPAVMALGKRLEGRIIALFDRIEARREAARSRHLLHALDDRALADIGLSRGDVDRF